MGAWLATALVGHAHYDRLPEGDVAEVALEVADACQGLGVGTAMLEVLAERAVGAGLRRFVAHVLPTNQRMLQVFRDLGFAERAVFEDGVIRVELELGSTDRFREARRARHARETAGRRGRSAG